MAHKAMAKQTLAAMWPEDGESEDANVIVGYLVFVGIRLAMVLGAALLVYWQVSTQCVGSRRCSAAARVLAAQLTLTHLLLLTYLLTYSLTCLLLTSYSSQPDAAISGLPKIKSNLNGTKIPGYLSFRVLVAKIVGITLVVGSGLPLGKEGPMVHIGAAVASLLSNVQVGWMRDLFELRLPSSQRGWVGMGAAAGVAAAFNAPLGGILYSFEEVCSHWSASMTWRSFVCAVVVAASSTFLNEFGGALTLLTYLLLPDPNSNLDSNPDPDPNPNASPKPNPDPSP